MAGGEEEDEIVESFSTTPGSITDIVSMAQNRDPSLRFLPQNRYVQKNFYKAADGGIARLANGGGAGQEQMMQALQAEYMKYKQQGGTMPFEQFARAIMQQQQQGQTQMAANGGRMGYYGGGDVQEDVEVINEDRQEVASNNENTRILELLFEKYLDMGMSMEEAESAARMEFDQMSQAPAMQEQETIVEDRVMANSGGS